MVVNGRKFFCGVCGGYFIQEHFDQHKKEMNTDAVEHDQYQGNFRESPKDYMVCLEHQKIIENGICPKRPKTRCGTFYKKDLFESDFELMCTKQIKAMENLHWNTWIKKSHLREVLKNGYVPIQGQKIPVMDGRKVEFNGRTVLLLI